MKIEGTAAVVLMKVNMRVDGKGETNGVVFEKDQFSARLPKEVAEVVEIGDYLEVLCIPDWMGSSAEMVLQVERWIQGNGLGKIIFCVDEYWEGVLRHRSPV